MWLPDVCARAPKCLCQEVQPQKRTTEVALASEAPALVPTAPSWRMRKPSSQAAPEAAGPWKGPLFCYSDSRYSLSRSCHMKDKHSMRISASSSASTASAAGGQMFCAQPWHRKRQRCEGQTPCGRYPWGFGRSPPTSHISIESKHPPSIPGTACSPEIQERRQKKTSPSVRSAATLVATEALFDLTSLCGWWNHLDTSLSG